MATSVVFEPVNKKLNGESLNEKCIFEPVPALFGIGAKKWLLSTLTTEVSKSIPEYLNVDDAVLSTEPDEKTTVGVIESNPLIGE